MMMTMMMMMIITHYDDDDGAPNAVSWNYAMRPTKTTNLWSVHQTKQWDLLSTSESPRFCKWIYSPYYFCTALAPPILSRAVRPRALIQKKHVSIQRLGAFLQCLDGSRAMWKKCGITIGVHIMFVGSVESFMMLHFFSVGVAVMDLHLFNALMATDQDQHENICAQIVMRIVLWCCISRSFDGSHYIYQQTVESKFVSMCAYV